MMKVVVQHVCMCTDAAAVAAAVVVCVCFFLDFVPVCIVQQWQ